MPINPHQIGRALISIDSAVYQAFPDFTNGSKATENIVSDTPDLHLAYCAQQGLTLNWHKKDQKKPLIFHSDFVPKVAKLKSFPAAKQGAFNQALGKKTTTVLDATGGWGDDALLMASQGYRVHILERNPVMALMLQDAFARLDRALPALEIPMCVPSVDYADSVSRITEFASWADCAYLDPMFPPKKKKSAAVNKQMQLLQWLVGQDTDANLLLTKALRAGFKRIAVKRPAHATPLGQEHSRQQPNQQFTSKLVHYDVYYNRSASANFS